MTNNGNMITFSEDVPNWIRDWSSWTRDSLLSEWKVNVSMVDKLDPDPDDLGDDRPGEIICSSENLKAEVKFLRSMKDNEEGWIEVVHELCHAFVSRMSESAKNLISSKVVKRTAWKSYDAAEETSVVQLSRLLVKLRMDATDKKC